MGTPRKRKFDVLEEEPAAAKRSRRVLFTNQDPLVHHFEDVEGERAKVVPKWTPATLRNAHEQTDTFKHTEMEVHPESKENTTHRAKYTASVHKAYSDRKTKEANAELRRDKHIYHRERILWACREIQAHDEEEKHSVPGWDSYDDLREMIDQSKAFIHRHRARQMKEASSVL